MRSLVFEVMCYWQFYGILLELIIWGEWGEFGIPGSCGFPLPVALPLSPCVRLKPLAERGSQSDLWGKRAVGAHVQLQFDKHFPYQLKQTLLIIWDPVKHKLSLPQVPEATKHYSPVCSFSNLEKGENIKVANLYSTSFLPSSAF